MKKLTDAEAQILTELDGAPDNQLRVSTLHSSAPYLGINPRRLRLIFAALEKAGLVEKSVPYGRDMPTWLILTSAGKAALEAWQNDVPEMVTF